MAFPFTPANKPLVRHYPIKAAEAWTLGAVLLLDANEDLIEAAADPTLVLGFALAPASAGDLVGELAGLGLEMPVAVAEAGKRFWCAGDNDPVKADINQKFGVTGANSDWTLDGTETGVTVLYVHDIDLDRNLYLVSVIAAIQQYGLP